MVSSETKKPIIDALKEADYFVLDRYYKYSEDAVQNPNLDSGIFIRRVAGVRYDCVVCLEYLSTNNPPFNDKFFELHGHVIEFIDEEIARGNFNERDVSSMRALRDKLYHSVRQF